MHDHRCVAEPGFGIMRRYRHLMLDLGQLLPHAKKDFKLDTKSDRGVINEARRPA